MGLKGYRLWDMGQLDSTCRAPPRLPRSSARARPTPSGTAPGGLTPGLSLPGVSDWLHVRPELNLWVALTPGGSQMGCHSRVSDWFTWTGCDKLVFRLIAK
jgi:hypothetical protein